MYDRSGEANEFVGESVEDATGSAARFYGVEREELQVVVPEIGEIAGTGGRTVVVAFAKGARRPQGRSPGRERRERRERRPEGERASPEDREREEAPARPQAPVGESRGTVRDEVGPVGEFLLGVVERMGLGGFEIGESAEEGFLVYQIRGEASMALRSGDGRSVDALQLLANEAAKRAIEGAPRVVVDVEGDAEDREVSLGKLADRAAARALESGRAIALDPMNPRDRRMIHVALRERERIATMSIGSGRYRQVVVVPEGAPEYEEAAEAADNAQS